MIATDTFVGFARRMASTQGYPNIVIVETPNPLRHFEPEVLRARVEAMMPAVIDGLTLTPNELERRSKDVAAKSFSAKSAGRSSVSA